jgi:hypothetical protein
MNMQTQEHIQAAYDLFVDVYSARVGKTEAQARAEVSPQEFDKQIRDLYPRYMNQEFSIGKFADLLQVPVLNLYDILNELGLDIRYA